MEEFFARWFRGFGEGLAGLSREERGRLFAPCAALCARDALRDLYLGLFRDCGGDLDQFFSRLHEVRSVDGRVIEPGKVYEILFLACGCDLHVRAGVNAPELCECSRQSIIAEFRELLPGKEFEVEERGTILGGEECCCFRITV